MTNNDACTTRKKTASSTTGVQAPTDEDSQRCQRQQRDRHEQVIRAQLAEPRVGHDFRTS